MLDFSVTFVITIINIAILAFILRKILFRPVTKFVTDRANRIQESIEQTEKDRTQVKALLAKYDSLIKTAETEANEIIDIAREHAREEAEKIIADSRVSAEAAIASARRQIEMEKNAAMAVFRKDAAALVVAASGRLLGREIKSEDCVQYADMLLEEVSSGKMGGS